MRPLKELITIDTRFRKSVNLHLDLGDYEKVGEYIPTKSSVKILKDYLEIVQGKNSANANILIGPYGKGKSHLLLVLLAILKGEHKKLKNLFQNIQGIEEEASEKIKNLWDTHKPFLPVLVSTTGNDLNASLIQALREALVRENLENLAPDSYYSEAVKSIHRWKKHFPDTYEQWERFLKKRGYTTTGFVRELQNHNKNVLQLFMELYPKLTAGSRFQPMLQQEALQLYRDVNHKLCEEYEYSGIYIIFDEFSKYIEGHVEENFARDMKILQDMCELANNSMEEKLFITLVAHKSIHEYEKNIPNSVKNAFKGVEGRLKEIRFIVSAQNNYELIADTIKKNEPEFTEELQKRMEEPHIHKVIEETFALPCFQSLFTQADYQRVLVRGCFPMLPLCAYSVLHLSEKVAQNERTIFTFLTNDEPGSLVRILKKGAEDFIGIDAVYDYFQSLFRESADMPEIHSEWLKADYALQLAENEIEKKIIKALAIIRMLHREDEVPAQDKPLRLSVGISKEEYKKAMADLCQRGLVLYRSSLGMYAFKNKVGVDVEAEIAKEMSGISKGFQLCEKIAEVSELEYIIPRKYNQDYTMTRYFSYEYMTPEAFLKLEQAKYLFEKKDSDGKIIALVSEKEIPVQAIKEHTQRLQEERIVVLVPQNTFSQTENLKRLLAVGALQENESLIEENKVLLQELKLYQEDLSFEINVALEESFLPENQKSMVVHLGEEQQGFTATSFHIFLSSILEEYYEYTPKINHELLNIQNVTGQYLRARNQVVDAILSEQDCEKYLKGTNPESMVYRATFVRTGVIEQQGGARETDQGCKELLKEIGNYFGQCMGQKQSFSLLYEKLQGKDYGVRKGILPLFIAMKLARLEETAVVYFGKKELDINAEVLNYINEAPEKYQLYIEAEKKEEYLEGLEEIFCENQGKIFTKQMRLRRISEDMQRWYRGLPQYAMITRNFPEEHLEAVRFVRNLLKRAELNPRELIFERLPQGLAASDLNQTLLAVKKVRQMLDQAVVRLEEEIIAEIKTIFGAKEQESLKGCLILWYQQYEEKASASILKSLADHFMRYLRELQEKDSEKIVWELSRRLLDMYFEDWNDSTREEFVQVLQQVKEEVEAVAEKDVTASGKCRIILQNENGKDILNKSYDENQEDSTVDFFKNMISEALEEFEGTLETNQKVTVLAKAIMELLQ